MSSVSHTFVFGRTKLLRLRPLDGGQSLMLWRDGRHSLPMCGSAGRITRRECDAAGSIEGGIASAIAFWHTRPNRE